MMPSCRVFLVFIILTAWHESVDSKLSSHRFGYMCKSWKSCPLQIPLKKCSKNLPLRLDQICDDKPQCPCGDDEENCDPSCPSQLRCRNKTCLSASKVCDGISDCLEHEDELMCPKQAPGYRTCEYGGLVCYTPLPDNVPEGLFFKTFILPYTSSIVNDCKSACTLNNDCKSTWLSFIKPQYKMMKCRLSTITGAAVAIATSQELKPSCMAADSSFTQTTCQEHPAQ